MTKTEQLIRSFNKVRREKFDAVAVNKLCRLLGLTLGEMAARLDYSESSFLQYVDSNRIPGTACIQLEMWQAFLDKELSGKHARYLYPDPVTDFITLVTLVERIALGDEEDPQKACFNLLARREELLHQTLLKNNTPTLESEEENG